MNSNSEFREKVIKGYLEIIGKRKDSYVGLYKWVRPKDIVEETGILYRTVLYHCQRLTIKGVFQMKTASGKYSFFCMSQIPEGYVQGRRRDNWKRLKPKEDVDTIRR